MRLRRRFAQKKTTIGVTLHLRLGVTFLVALSGEMVSGSANSLLPKTERTAQLPFLVSKLPVAAEYSSSKLDAQQLISNGGDFLPLEINKIQTLLKEIPCWFLRVQVFVVAYTTLVRCMKRLFNLILVSYLLSIFAFGQDETKLLELQLWRIRADTLTNNLLKDAAKGDALDRALLLAQLSDLWWESDRNQANTWIEKSVDTIYFYPSDDVKAQSEKFFRVLRQILALISAHNPKQSNRLLEILSKTDDISEKEKNSNADALIEFALQIVKTNPDKAAELGTRAFSFGYPKEFYKLSWELRRYNATLADKFFRTAFSYVAAAPDYEKLYGMQLAALPESVVPNFPPNLKPPIRLRTLFLNFLADYLTQQQLRFSSKSISSCSSEATLVSRLQNYFAELLPQKTAIVQQNINICLANQSREAQQLTTNTTTPKSSNVDELLKQADEIHDNPLIRVNYLFKAVLAANQQKNYAKSIQILESMNDDERKVDMEFWEELRFDSGAGLAVAQFKDENLAGASKTLRDVPDAIRPLAQITFVLKCSPEDVSSYPFCVELLNDARRGIIKSELPFTRKTSYWFNLVKLYSNYKSQTEAAEVFREIAVAFNGSLSDDTPKITDAVSDQLISDAKRIIPMLSPILLEVQENSIFESIGLLKQEKARVQVNLAFLKMALRKYQSLSLEIQKKPETKSTPTRANPKQKEN